MGCDIHLHVEYDISTRPGAWRHVIPAIQLPEEPFSRADFIRSLSESEFFISRDYRLFAALAGVRRLEGEDPEPLVAPRGFPAIACSDTVCGFFHYVCDDGEDVLDGRDVTRQDADAYVARGRSFYRDHHLKPRGLVSDPGWHTPTWLLVSEVRRALARFSIDPRDSAVEFLAVLAAAESLEAACGEGRVRLVFWFDN